MVASKLFFVFSQYFLLRVSPYEFSSPKTGKNGDKIAHPPLKPSNMTQKFCNVFVISGKVVQDERWHIGSN